MSAPEFPPAQNFSAQIPPTRRRDLIRDERAQARAAAETAKHVRSETERVLSLRARRASSPGGIDRRARGLAGGVFAAAATMMLVGVTGTPVFADPSLPIETLIAPNAAAAGPAQTFTSEATEPVSVQRDAFGVTVQSAPPPPAPGTGIRWPIPASSKIGSAFGWRVPPCYGCSSDHRGVDFNPGEGTPVVAVAKGVVSETGNPNGEYGVYVVIDHVVNGQRFSTVYAHLQSGSMALAVGDLVAGGQRIGRVGNTGQSTGPHLHFEVRIGGETVDPYSWLRRYAAR